MEFAELLHQWRTEHPEPPPQEVDSIPEFTDEDLVGRLYRNFNDGKVYRVIARYNSQLWDAVPIDNPDEEPLSAMTHEILSNPVEEEHGQVGGSKLRCVRRNG